MRSITRAFSNVSKDFKTVGVVGLGLMGHGIAQSAAEAKYKVIAVESNDAALKAGQIRITDSLKKKTAREIKKGAITEADGQEYVKTIFNGIKFSTTVQDIADCDLIVEAIAENIDLKISFYTKLGSIAKSEAIFGSNTSSLPITSMAKASGRPDKFIGLHFFNPVQIMKLVEIIRTEYTTDETYEAVKIFGTRLGKSVVTCGDTPGFIVNRLLIPYLVQSMALLDRSVATIPDIDTSMRLGASHPMGPLELADYIGLDTVHHIIAGWVHEFPEERAFFIPKVLQTKVGRGEFGRKTGRGFYLWEGDKCTHKIA